ncbi:MAG: hypothetical protein OdinLCB4_000555 [Candidatus Odinarchaeum yellowstonii]|uniref:Uncharacterized protein n=1 Tax=Odinarchaeota yellowstonii (strain LCB_4) TaxID=1841599 RepID=A0AAF0D2I2_ODILC|nr:MAG: hypothetical protein OdinLCB4_000555 [Candidatus Odinarchaeum yellowstonii]
MKLYDLYIIYRDGRNILHKGFCESNLDATIISGFLNALTEFSKEALPSDGLLNVIEKGNVKVIFNHGSFLLMALICEAVDRREIIYLNNRLAELTELLETQYREVLKDWNGDLNSFKELGEVVSEVFREVVRLSQPPNIKELADKRRLYYYSVDEEGFNIFNTFYKDSISFKNFLKTFSIPDILVSRLIDKLRSTYLTLDDIKNEFNIDEGTLLRIIKNLTLRGIISVCR